MAKKGKYYQRKDGLYEAIRTINGKRVAFRGKTEREVERKMLAYKEKAESGKTFAEVADEWLIEKEHSIREATRLLYNRETEKAKEYFTGSIKSIRPLDVKRYISKIIKKGYSGETTSKGLGVLQQIFSYAVIEGYIDVSPAAEVRVPKGLPKKKREALTAEQEAIVRRSGIERKATFWLFPYLLLFTGMRRGEALALTYADIDRKNMVIHVNKKVDYSTGAKPKLDHFLKSENGERDIPLLPPLADALPKNAIGLVFPGKSGSYMTDTEMRGLWKKYCFEVGFVEDGGEKLEYPITPHCMRHSFATICFEAGLDPRSAAEFLGDNVQTLEAVYTHLRAEKKESAADKLIKHFAAV